MDLLFIIERPLVAQDNTRIELYIYFQQEVAVSLKLSFLICKMVLMFVLIYIKSLKFEVDLEVLFRFWLGVEFTGRVHAWILGLSHTHTQTENKYMF
jgi:hypothetical protein